MRNIQSIIVFNSATAGDFLTSLCWSQLNLSNTLYNQQDSGRIKIKNMYFKDTTRQLFYNPDLDIEFDYSKIFPVENSHYWIDCYSNIAEQCFFIDYPDSVQPGILDIYLEKVFDNNVQKMLDLNLPNLHPYLAAKTTVYNIVDILNVQWLKNIKAWRENSNLSAIKLEDFFNKTAVEKIVKMLINRDISDQPRFDEIYKTWIGKNSKLMQLF
jgi:hypothetical protein